MYLRMDLWMTSADMVNHTAEVSEQESFKNMNRDVLRKIFTNLTV